MTMTSYIKALLSAADDREAALPDLRLELHDVVLADHGIVNRLRAQHEASLEGLRTSEGQLVHTIEELQEQLRQVRVVAHATGILLESLNSMEQQKSYLLESPAKKN